MELHEQISLWVDEYVDRLTHLAFTYVKDWGKAEDVVQEAFIKAYRSIHQLNTPENPLPWLIRIVINECRTSYRKTKRELVTSLIPHGISRSAEETYLQIHKNKDIHSAILSLRESYRNPIYLFYVEGLSTQEIASVLDISPGAVRVRLNRGREQLLKQLKRGDENEDGRLHPARGSKVQNTYRG